MSLLSRSIVVATTSVALMGLAACGDTNGLAKLDPCKIMSPQQLTADDIETQGMPSGFRNEPGCTFRSHSHTMEISFAKNQAQTVDSYQQLQPWQSYTKTAINGRPAASAVPDGGSASGTCTVLMDAGGGVVFLVVLDGGKTGDQACAEDMKYAQQVEPALPK